MVIWGLRYSRRWALPPQYTCNAAGKGSRNVCKQHLKCVIDCCKQRARGLESQACSRAACFTMVLAGVERRIPHPFSIQPPAAHLSEEEARSVAKMAEIQREI